MRRSKVMSRLRAGKPVRMCVLGHYIPAYVKMAAAAGFDCIWFDLEHREMDPREVQAMMAYFHLADIDCMLRAPTLEKTRLYRYLEEGATGLMIPLVSTAEKAHMLAQSVKFPPLGDRGLDGAGLDADYYVSGAEGFTEHANRETFLVVQIETPEAVQNAEAIAATAGVEGLFIGPGDLGLRLKNMSNPPFDLDGAVQRVAAACKKHGKAWGQPASSVEHLKKLTDLGAQLMAWGSEFGALRSMLEERSREWQQVLGENAGEQLPESRYR